MFDFRKRGADEWALLKDVIRTELSPLRTELSNLSGKVDSLSAAVQNTYNREIMDEKLRQRDESIRDTVQSIKDVGVRLDDHIQRQEAEPTKRLDRMSMKVAIFGGTGGVVFALVDIALHLLGVGM